MSKLDVRAATAGRMGVGAGNLLLEADGTETGVESAETLGLHDLRKSTEETVGVGRVGDETNTGSLERAKGNVGEELGKTGGDQVNTSAVVRGVLVADDVNGLLLEELVTSELEGTLQEVTSGGGAESGQQSTGTLILDDLLEATDHTPVVGLGVELDTGLDAVAVMPIRKCASLRERRATSGPQGSSDRIRAGRAGRNTGRIHWVAKLKGAHEVVRVRILDLDLHRHQEEEASTYTSTGVRAPCVTEQQTAPARANLE